LAPTIGNEASRATAVPDISIADTKKSAATAMKDFLIFPGMFFLPTHTTKLQPDPVLLSEQICPGILS
jgi:hypothetical protein